jgi:DNA-binding response OmpR family regulator
MAKVKILIVDNDANFTKMVKLNLENAGGYEVRTETDSQKALAAALEFRPDLILLDIIMPDIDGGEVARRITSHEALKDTPILFLTAIVDGEELACHGAVIGGYRFIAKPIDTRELIDIIQKNISR